MRDIAMAQVKLFKLEAALSAMGYIAENDYYYGNSPPDNFSYGLSVVLGYLEREVAEAYEFLEKDHEEIPKEEKHDDNDQKNQPG